MSHFGSILLYSKVGEPAVMQEVTRAWLHYPSNSRATSFGTVAELYLLHVLVPLGEADEARELVTGEVFSAFTEEHRQTALDIIEEKERQNQDPPLNPRMSGSSDVTEHPVSSQGLTLQPQPL